MSIDPKRLRVFEALRDLAPLDIMQMAEQLEHTRFRHGAQLCREGDEGDACYFLLEGKVEVTKNLPDGRRVHLATLPEGTLFGQSGLMPGQIRTADVKADGNVEVGTLTRRKLTWALRQSEGWAVAVQAIVAVDLVRQLRSALDRLAGLAADENPEEAAQGRTRASIPQPKSVDVTITKRKPEPVAAKAKKKKPTEDDWKPLPEIPDDDETNMSQRGLLALLAETESSLAGLGYDVDEVDFVFDEDMQRTADARRQR